MTLDLHVDEDELAKRAVGWEPLPPKYTRGVLGKYRKVVQSRGPRSRLLLTSPVPSAEAVVDRLPG